MTVSLEFSKAWRAAFPDAAIGLLELRSVLNLAPGQDFLAALHSVEARVRVRHAGQSRSDLESMSRLRPYIDYYRRFGKTYHVLLQLESVAFHGRPLPAREALVSAMFAAEIDNLLLTAGHDLKELRSPLIADVTQEGERYVGIGGRVVEVRPGDMSIRDAEGILSTVLYGPDQRTRLGPTTDSVLFTTYAPAGISRTELESHLRGIEALVRAESPLAITKEVQIRRS